MVRVKGTKFGMLIQQPALAFHLFQQPSARTEPKKRNLAARRHCFETNGSRSQILIDNQGIVAAAKKARLLSMKDRAVVAAHQRSDLDPSGERAAGFTPGGSSQAAKHGAERGRIRG